MPNAIHVCVCVYVCVCVCVCVRVDLDDYGKPLPPPPPGFYWSREQDGSWVILHYSTHHSSKSKEDAFVTVENSSVVEHVVLPGDTLQGE